jgi:hypothetical protein
VDHGKPRCRLAATNPALSKATLRWEYKTEMSGVEAVPVPEPVDVPARQGGHLLTGQAMAEAVQRVAGGSLPIKPFNLLPIYLAAPLVRCAIYGRRPCNWTTHGWSACWAPNRIRRWTRPFAPASLRRDLPAGRSGHSGPR